MGMSGATTPDDAFRELVQGLIDANLVRQPARALRRVSPGGGVPRSDRRGRRRDDPDVAGRPPLAGTVLVHDGRDPWAEVVVRAEGIALLELAATPLRFDLPDVTTAAGRDVVRKLLGGRIRVHGMVRHLGTVRRLSMLLSAR